MPVAALSQASRPAICSGDQPCPRRSSTRRRSSPSRSSRDPVRGHPEQIAGRLAYDKAAGISHEGIYRFIYA
jgi:IS30 family transposase